MAAKEAVKPATEFTKLVREPSVDSQFANPPDIPDKGIDLLSCLGSIKCNRPYLVEPAFLLFEIADWSSTTLTTQYIYSRIAQNLSQDVNSSVVHGNSSSWEHALEPYSLDYMDSSNSYASYFVLYMNLLSNFPAIAITLLVCAYGDIIGRKLGLVLPTMGGAMKAMVYLWVAYNELPLWTLGLGHFFEGLGGTHFTFTGSAHAYIADVAQPQHLTLRYTILQTLLLVASTVGNMSVGYLISAGGFLRCFTLLLGIYTVAGLYIIGYLPESLRIKDPVWQSVPQMLRNTLEAFKVYTRRRPAHLARLHLGLLLIVKLVNTIIFVGLVDVQTLYLLSEPFKFSSVKIGYFLSESTLLNALGPLLLVPILQTGCKCLDTNVCMVSALSGALSFLVLGLSTNQTMVFISPVIGGLMAGISPVTRAMMSKRVQEDEQGGLINGSYACDVDLATLVAATNSTHRSCHLLTRVCATCKLCNFRFLAICGKCSQCNQDCGLDLITTLGLIPVHPPTPKIDD
ncbi:hypothetical protein CAPTEDRAFT_198737 [Capitella teleta]|uniref:Major facilitator superfamily (MFS) profile domain-containing protein n=1 Tax=Capitella teleta TaxID=283909 RepID=R7VB53_CAPTE|nr:hypothetical protein CAPTEDRAFT_198737 [Capitella teleta]|eukprot:ELU12935.1 hypothetical protein CAPTEDRAFT_198737 [Capitella teleta]